MHQVHTWCIPGTYSYSYLYVLRVHTSTYREVPSFSKKFAIRLFCDLGEDLGSREHGQRRATRFFSTPIPIICSLGRQLACTAPALIHLSSVSKDRRLPKNSSYKTGPHDIKYSLVFFSIFEEQQLHQRTHGRSWSDQAL